MSTFRFMDLRPEHQARTLAFLDERSLRSVRCSSKSLQAAGSIDLALSGVIHTPSRDRTEAWQTHYRLRSLTQAGQSAGRCVALFGDYFFVGSANGAVLQLDRVSGTVRQTLSHHTAEVTCLAVDENVRSVRAGRVYSGSADRTVAVWNVADRSMPLIGSLEGHEGSILDIGLAGHRIVSTSQDQSVRVWCAATYACLRQIAWAHPVPRLCIERHEVFAPLFKRVTVLNLASGIWREVAAGQDPITQIAVTDNLICSGTMAGVINVWNRQNGSHVMDLFLNRVQSGHTGATFYSGGRVTALLARGHVLYAGFHKLNGFVAFQLNKVAGRYLEGVDGLTQAYRGIGGAYSSHVTRLQVFPRSFGAVTSRGEVALLDFDVSKTEAMQDICARFITAGAHHYLHTDWLSQRIDVSDSWSLHQRLGQLLNPPEQEHFYQELYREVGYPIRGRVSRAAISDKELAIHAYTQFELLTDLFSFFVEQRKATGQQVVNVIRRMGLKDTLRHELRLPAQSTSVAQA